MNLLSMDGTVAKGINKVVLMIYLGMLWFLFSIPIVTMGAATAAIYEVMFQAIRDREGYLTKSFIQAFRSNLKQGMQMGIPVLMIKFIFLVNLFYYGVFSGSGHEGQKFLFIVLLLAVTAFESYIFPVIGRFENTIRGHFQMAVRLAVKNIGWTILLVLLHILMLFVIYFFLYIPILFIMGIFSYFQAGICSHIFDRWIELGFITQADQHTEERYENEQ